MKSIYINGRFLCQDVMGVQRYALEMVKALDELVGSDKELQRQYAVEILSPNNIIHKPKLKYIQLRTVGKMNGHIWEQLELPLYSKKGLLVNLCNTAPVFKGNQAITIHDAAVFANPTQYKFAFRFWYQLLYKIFKLKGSPIITVSNFSKSELKKYVNINVENLHVIYEGREHILNTVAEEKILKRFDLKQDGYVLAVSSNSPNKNFNSVIKAIQMLGNVNYDFVIAGGSHNKVFANNQIQLADNVKKVGYVSDEELKALYSNAGCFIYPSFYEGFGLPPLEAMSCGCPVIISNSGSLPEIFQDAALYCDPNDVSNIADKISMLMEDQNLREQFKAKGYSHVSQFQWNKSAEQSLKVYEGAIQ